MAAAKILFPLLTFQASVVAASNFVPISLGPEFQSPFSDGDMLRGFKLNVAEGESALKQPVFKADLVAIPFATSYTKSEVIKSVHDLTDMMEIQGNLGVSYGPMISGEGSGSFLENKVSSKRQVSVLYRTRRLAYAKSIDWDTLKPVDGLELLRGDEIAEAYGSKFIDQVLYGAQLDVRFTVESAENIDLQEIEAELKGKIGVGVLSIEFQAKFEKKEGESRSELQMFIEAYASGVDFSTPANPSFDQVNQLIDDFNAKYDKLLDDVRGQETVDVEQNVLKQLSPVGFTLASIADHTTKLSAIETAALDARMEDLRDVFYAALYWSSRLKFVRTQVEKIYGEDPRSRNEIFQPYKDQMDIVISKLGDKVDECLQYRRLPLATLVGRDGVDEAKVPAQYPDSNEEDDVVQGLAGLAYLPSPVVIGSSRFDNMHYIGYALPKGINGSLVPWMSGTLRNDNGNSIVASAETPEELERLAKLPPRFKGKIYRTNNREWCMGKHKDDSNVLMQRCEDAQTQVWEYIPAKQELVLSSQGGCLTRERTNNNLHISRCRGEEEESLDQKFVVSQNGKELSLQVDKGMCMDQSSPNDNLYMFPCHKNWNQQFDFVHESIYSSEDIENRASFRGQIHHAHDRYWCMDKKQSDSNVYMNKCNGSPTQIWEYNPITKDMWNAHDNQCLVLDEDDHNNLFTTLCYGKGSTRDRFVLSENGQQLKLKADEGLCLDRSTGDYPNMYMYPCHKEWNQQFHFVEESIYMPGVP